MEVPPIENLAGKIVLDAGCGDGSRYLFDLARSGLRVAGCDLCLKKLYRAAMELRKIGAAAELQAADLRALPYAAETFDFVLCLHVLPYHIRREIGACLSELWRVLVPGGLLYADFLDRKDIEYGCGEEVEPHTFLDPDGLPVHFAGREEIEDWLTGWAIQSLKIFERGGIHGKRVVWEVVAGKVK